MIYQCYYEETQRQRLFTSPLYRGFGVNAEVNPDIARNCPELLDPSHVRQMSEYAAMLHNWRNPERDPDPWIGFTSYRQLDKFPTVFEERRPIEQYLADADIIGWGWYEIFDHANRQPLTLAEHSERCHPGIHSALWRLLMLHNQAMPDNYLAGNIGLYCNYWVMSKANFKAYMEWSAPLVRYALENPDAFAEKTPRALAFLVERLFMCWYGIDKKRAIQVGQPVGIISRNALYRAYLQPLGNESPEMARRGKDMRLRLIELRLFELHDSGRDPFVVELLPNGELVAPGPRPRWWQVRHGAHDVLLEFTGPGGRIAFLLPEGQDTWRGRWVVGPHDEIVLRPRMPKRAPT